MDVFCRGTNALSLGNRIAKQKDGKKFVSRNEGKMNPKWFELLNWVNNPARTRGELQAACVGLGLGQAGGVNALRTRLQTFIGGKPDQNADSPWTPAGWVPAVRTITVTAPAGAVVWSIGSAQTITWNSVGIAPADLVNVEISRDGGPFTAIANNVPNSGSHNWAAVTGPATANAKIRVSTVAAPAVSGQSAAAFTVSQPARRGPLAGNPWVRGAALLATGLLFGCLLIACALGVYALATGARLPTPVAVATAAPASTTAPTAAPTDKFGCPSAGGFADQADLKVDNPTSPTLGVGQVGFVWGSHVYINNVDQGRQAYFLLTPGTYGQLKVQDGAFRWYDLGSATPDQFKAWAKCFIEKAAGAHNWGELTPVGAPISVQPTSAPSAPIVGGEYRSEVGADGVRFFSKKAHAFAFNGTNFGTYEDGSDPAPCGKYRVLPGQVANVWWNITLNGRALGSDNYAGAWLQPGEYDICGSGRIRVWSFNADAGVPSLYEPWWEHKVETEAGRPYTWIGRLRR